jgi:lysophospholipase L1-like esterase
MDTDNRRGFIKSTFMLAAGATLPVLGYGIPVVDGLDDRSGLKILFQGDSITDGNRSRNNDWNHIMGHGYQYIISSKLWFEQPNKQFHFFNKGISGNKISDLAVRWQDDTLALKPDILSILIGVNDTNEAVNKNTEYTPESYQNGYRELLKRTRQENPNIQLVIGEPFLLPVGRVKDNWKVWFDAISPRQVIAKDIAREFGAVFVPFQSAFNNALKSAPADYWIWDGIHPMPAGHELMAREWLKTVNKSKLF